MAYKELPAAGEIGSGQEKTTYRVLDWNPIDRGALKAAFTLILPYGGLSLLDCRLFESGGSRWINVPTQRFRGNDGLPAYKPLIEFRSAAARADFLREALAAVDRHAELMGLAEPEQGEVEQGQPSTSFFDDDDCAEGSEVGHVL